MPIGYEEPIEHASHSRDACGHAACQCLAAFVGDATLQQDDAGIRLDSDILERQFGEVDQSDLDRRGKMRVTWAKTLACPLV